MAMMFVYDRVRAAVTVNLYSDTQTRPTAAMREAMASAEVGDEQRMEDPAVNELCTRVADLLGKDAAVFLPSGTMCNAIALRLHVRPGGDEVILHRWAHPLRFEAGGPAAISGAVMCPVDGPDGMFDAQTLLDALRPMGDRYAPRSRLVCVEQTTNIGGGRVWPLEQVRAVVELAQAYGLRTHLDGARLMNAVVASGVDAAAWSEGFDTAWLDFTKGLGAPVGAVLAGSVELIDEAWRYKQMWGGAMRQAGIIAAGALYALDHHVERLAEDHANARALAEGLAELPGVVIDPAAVDTNIVVFEVPDSQTFAGALAAEDVIVGPLDARRMRAVTHLDVDAEGIAHALDAARRALGG
jgi:threonine aldolase